MILSDMKNRTPAFSSVVPWSIRNIRSEFSLLSQNVLTFKNHHMASKNGIVDKQMDSQLSTAFLKILQSDLLRLTLYTVVLFIHLRFL